jgi:hypothetical protein
MDVLPSRKVMRLKGLADLVVSFTATDILAGIRFPRQGGKPVMTTASNWQLPCNHRLQFGKILVEDASVKAPVAQQISWKNNTALKAFMQKKAPSDQLVLTID